MQPVSPRILDWARTIALGWAAAFALLAAGCTGVRPIPAQPAAAAANLSAQATPPSLLLGELFSDVALSGQFEDGKDWADARPLGDAQDIVRAYRLERPTGAALRSFVDRHFELPRTGAGAAPPPGLPLCRHINGLWPLLTREAAAPPPRSSLLPLPRRFVVPGGRFREVYYWDSYFTMLGFGHAEADLRRAMVDNFAYLIRTYGHVPNGNRTYYLSRSQPPFFFKMVEQLAPDDPPRAFAEYLGALRREHEFWMDGADGLRPGEARLRVVALPNGAILNRYYDARDVPRDESYAADVGTAARAYRPAAEVYRDLRAAAESGWDFSSRWLADRRELATIRTTSIVPPDLNALLHGLEQAIAAGCGRAGDAACAQAFAAKAEARRAAMTGYLWNEANGLFDDLDWRRGALVGNISAASLYPLFTGVATPRQAARTARTIRERLLVQGGLATTDQTTSEQWDAPNGWAPLQWIAVEGLGAYGETALAEEIARRWLATVGRTYRESGRLLEKYDVAERRPGGGGEYPLQDGFGWTNGVTVALVRRFGAGVLPADGSANVDAEACMVPDRLAA
ncbi:alpha,alpha-trehalase TreF [Sphingosinicella terrae]|uniref:alpha,alpha-trehalase TreF n=1 Tax=Sphingosinicella terrae TaxID=2172047 RepID=UPI000E0CE313|nr:alpha,alpha-trehalase TreF [Sphingosinicella terrae]